MNNNDKIINIKDMHKALLELVKNKIKDNSVDFSNNTQTVIEALNYDSEMVKKYEAIIETKKLIIEFSNQIQEAKTVEEVIEIRKKLNNCINKVKREIISRNLEASLYDEYVMKATSLRKSISEYVRYLKREVKIREIESLSNEANTPENHDRLKKLLKNEISYGKRNLNKYNIQDNQEIIDDNHSSETESNELGSTEKEIEDGDNDKQFDGLREFTEIPLEDESKPQGLVGKNEDFRYVPKYKTYEDLYKYLDDKVMLFERNFRIKKAEKYTRSVIKNLRVFTKNIPILIQNRRRVKLMIKDFNLCTRQSELVGYIEYTKIDNSFITNMKKVFEGSSIDDKELYYLEEHQKCVDWIIDFCDENKLSLSYLKSA